MNDNSKQDYHGLEQVWLYFIRRTMGPGYASTTTNLQIVLNAQKNPYLNQATQKNACQILLPQKNPGIENFKPKKNLRSSPSLEIRITPPGLKTHEPKWETQMNIRKRTKKR